MLGGGGGGRMLSEFPPTDEGPTTFIGSVEQWDIMRNVILCSTTLSNHANIV